VAGLLLVAAALALPTIAFVRLMTPVWLNGALVHGVSGLPF